MFQSNIKYVRQKRKPKTHHAFFILLFQTLSKSLEEVCRARLSLLLDPKISFKRIAIH